LEGGPPGFTPGFSCRALLRNITTHRSDVAYRAITVSGPPFQAISAIVAVRVRESYNPAPTKERGLGSAPFARRY
jgi:hypothetical protein